MNKAAGPVGIVVALAGEAAVLGHAIPLEQVHVLSPHSRVYVCGIGAERAARAAQALVDTGAQALASFGTAGALAPELAAGDLLLPQELLDDSRRRFAIDPAWRNRLLQALPYKADARLLFSSALALGTVQAKVEARQNFDAAAVDMESAAVAAVAAHHGLPFLALRAIVDTARQTLPHAVLNGVDAWGRLRLIPFTRALLHSSSEIAALPALGRAFGRARTSLAAVLATAGTDLGFSSDEQRNH